LKRTEQFEEEKIFYQTKQFAKLNSFLPNIIIFSWMFLLKIWLQVRQI